jgi:hypothetical protein
LANPHHTTPYEVLKDRLLNNHSLTDFQKIERQFKIGDLGLSRNHQSCWSTWWS